MWKENEYRQKIRDEHWKEFMELVPELVLPFPTASAQAKYEMQLHFAAETIRTRYFQDYRDESDE